MEEEDRKRMRVHCSRITENLRAKDIVQHLFQNSVINANEMQAVTLPILTDRDGMLKLVSILLKKKGAFKIFCQVLEEIGSGWLVTEIMATDISKVLDEPNEALDELDAAEKVNMLQKQLEQQTMFIDMLVKMNKSSQDTQDGAKPTIPVTELPDLKQAMKEHNLSETEVVKYINYSVTRKSKPGADDTDSGKLVDRRRSMSASSLNFTETVAMTTAQDIVTYLACGEENSRPPKTKYEATMRRTVSELITNHRTLFEHYIQKIQDNEATGIDFLFNVADEIFRDGQHNWGRVAALYAFCGWLAKHDVFSETDQSRQTVGEFLGYYVSQKLGAWIEDNGGWVSVT